MKDIKSVFILGRQPALGLAELESLYGADSLHRFDTHLVGTTIDASEIDFHRLGGSIKLTRAIDTLHSASWQIIERAILKQVPRIAEKFDEGKITIGVSDYSKQTNSHTIQGAALKLKKIIRNKTNQSVRVVPNQEQTLSTAQVIHNNLTGPRGIEIVVFQHKDMVIITQTVAEQDIEAYTKRDQARPKRDARVGMLPPKLAQIIVNLTGAESGNTLWDPFCGTGVLLQEALLMDLDVYGSDLEPRMIEYTEKNLDWLAEEHDIEHGGTHSMQYVLEVGDATSMQFNNKHPLPLNVVACEGYLGQPFNTFPSEEKLRDVTQTCNQIMKGFLKNIAPQIESGTRLCVALPAWNRPNGRFEHLKMLDSLEELGYNRVSFVHVRDEDLLYYRPDQVVARELLVITRK